MPDARVTHNSFVLERKYPQAPRKVFAAFSEIEKKRRWYANGGAHDVVQYDLNFTRGGKEVLVGRMKPGTPIAGALLTWSQTFEEIVDGQRIVFTQTLDVGDHRISCALITVELFPEGAGCSVLLTHQGAFFEGADGPQMREMGWRALLDAVAAAIE